MRVELKNGKNSDKIGCNKQYQQHSVLQVNSKIRVLRVNQEDDCGIYGIEFLDKDKAIVSRFDLYPGREWKEYQIEEGEIITGIFGSIIPNLNGRSSLLYEMGFILASI